MSSLAISQSSRYYNELNDSELERWDYNQYNGFLPNTYIDKNDKFNLFLFTNYDNGNSLWGNFTTLENHYSNAFYEYDIIKNSGTIYFREFYNKTLINELEFDDPLHWNILSMANHKVVSVEILQNNLKEDIKDVTELFAAIDSLSEEGLLYKSEDYTEIVSVINTDMLQQ